MRQIGVLCIFAAAPAERIARQLCLAAIGRAEKRIANLAVIRNDLSPCGVHSVHDGLVSVIAMVYLVGGGIVDLVIGLAGR